MFRLLFLAAVTFAAVVTIDPIWNPEALQLTLRVRSPAEIFVVARERIQQIGDLVRADDPKSPAVAAPPPPARESFTPDERRKLGQLVEEHTRGG